MANEKFSLYQNAILGHSSEEYLAVKLNYEKKWLFKDFIHRSHYIHISSSVQSPKAPVKMSSIQQSLERHFPSFPTLCLSVGRGPIKDTVNLIYCFYVDAE